MSKTISKLNALAAIAALFGVTHKTGPEQILPLLEKLCYTDQPEIAFQPIPKTEDIN